MISEFENIKAQFNELNQKLSMKLEIYVIGGAVLLYHGLKAATKDVDIVVADEKEFNDLKHALEELDYAEQIPGQEYKRMDLNQIFVKKDFRFDLFQHSVCGKFFLSPGMKKRSLKILDLDKVKVSLCSIDDVFLFKTMTERPGDIEDCMALSQRGLDWDRILEELKHQAKKTKNDVWITWVAERLDVLVDKGVVVPKQFTNKLNILVNKYYKKLEKNLPDKNNKNKKDIP